MGKKPVKKKKKKQNMMDEYIDVKDAIKILEKTVAERKQREAYNKEMSTGIPPKFISLTALKGGTGKTILTFNIAALLATEFNKKVLVIDVDPQHNISSLLYKEKGVDDLGFDMNSYTESVMENSLEADEVVSRTHIPNLDIIPTTINLTVTEVQISGLAGRESILRNWVYDNQDYLSRYDYVFFDTNPTMSIVNINAFLCCDSIVLVSDVDPHAIGAVNIFMRLFFPIQSRVDRRLEDNIKGLIINKLIDNTNMTKDFLKFIKSPSFEFDDILLDSKIHYATSLSETKSTKEPINATRHERSYTEMVELIEEMMDKGLL